MKKEKEMGVWRCAGSRQAETQHACCYWLSLPLCSLLLAVAAAIQ